jgi:hypothetical protein
VKYDWIVIEQINGSYDVKTKYALGEKPWFNSEDGGGKQMMMNAIYPYKEMPSMDYSATAIAYGFQADGKSIRLGEVNFGFSYSNGMLTPIQPTTTYYRK